MNNFIAYFRDKNDSANVAKRRLKVAIGKAVIINIDNLMSDLRSAIDHSLAKYAIEGDHIRLQRSKNKIKVEIAVEEA